MQAVFDVVLPVFGIVLAGYLSGRVKLLGPDSSEALNKFCYWFALPPILFLGPARVPFAQVFDVPFLGTFVGGVAIAWLVALAVQAAFFRAGLAQTALALLAGTFSNVGYMGIPLFIAAFGAVNALPAVLITATYTLTLVAFTVILVESGLSGQGAAAGPCALFAIGLFLSTRSLATLAGGKKSIEVGWLVIVKLIVQPLATWVLAGYFGLSPFMTAASVILAALPSAALCFVLAQQYKLYVERASATILVSTVLSAGTISAVMILFADAIPPP
jgi:predicted permease